MRIIAGSLRGRKLKTLEGDLTRPTSSLVRQAMFNILAERIRDARVLDLYAGSGAIALEALSRGAREAVLIERAAEAQTIILENLRALGQVERAQLLRGEVLTTLPALRGPFDVVIADPPYRSVQWADLLLALLRPGLLSDQALVLLEHARGEAIPAAIEQLSCLRAYRYGETHLALYQLL